MPESSSQSRARHGLSQRARGRSRHCDPAMLHTGTAVDERDRNPKRVGLSRPHFVPAVAHAGLARADRCRRRSAALQARAWRHELSHVWLNGLDVVATARPIRAGRQSPDRRNGSPVQAADDHQHLGSEISGEPARLSMSRGVGHSLKIAQGSTGKAMLASWNRNARPSSCRACRRSAERNVEEVVEGRQDSGDDRPAAVKTSLARWRFPRPLRSSRQCVVGSVGLYGPEARIDDHKIEGYSALVREPAANIDLLGFQ